MNLPKIELKNNGLIAIVGAGTMGRGIAEVALSAGHPVVIYNHRERSLHAAETEIRSNFSRSVEKGRLSKAESETRLAHLQLSTDLSAIRDAFIVLETITEDIDLKLRAAVQN